MGNIKKYYLLLFTIVFLLGPIFNYSSATQNYVVGEGDVLEINVFGHDEMHTVVRVGADGTIILPLLKKVKVGGLTTSQISEKLARLLADGYIVDPQVSVFVKEYRNWNAVILGEVKKPGVQELTSQTTILELISRAGGLTENAGHKAIIKRKVLTKDGKWTTKTIVVDLWKLLEEGDTSQNILIHDDDTIYIGKGGFFYVTGEVKKPGSYKVTPDMTVIKAIALAGGFTDIASTDSVKIERKINGKKKVLEDVSLDTRVQAGDVIIVPESIF